MGNYVMLFDKAGKSVGMEKYKEEIISGSEIRA